MGIRFQSDWRTAVEITENYVGYLAPLIMAGLEREALRAPVTELGGLLGILVKFEHGKVIIESGQGTLAVSSKGESFEFEVEISPARSAG